MSINCRIKLTPEHFLNKLCVCAKNIVGTPTSYRHGVFFGLTLDGRKWQSRCPILVKDGEQNERA